MCVFDRRVVSLSLLLNVTEELLRDCKRIGSVALRAFLSGSPLLLFVLLNSLVDDFHGGLQRDELWSRVRTVRFFPRIVW